MVLARGDGGRDLECVPWSVLFRAQTWCEHLGYRHVRELPRDEYALAPHE